MESTDTANDAEVRIQRDYYRNTAATYDAQHVDERDEHYVALRFLDSIIGFYDIRSILDIGAGTGRVARYLTGRHSGLKVVSVEPVPELREIGHANGLTREELVEGDVNNLAFQNGEFDMVCAFGVLHHVPVPTRAIAEMLRVAKTGIFISDGNNFGQGSFLSRSVKQLINALGLWKVADFVKTRGKGYTITEGDGLAYSYSVFNNYKQIAETCNMHLFNTLPAGANLYRTASHVALLGIKK